MQTPWNPLIVTLLRYLIKGDTAPELAILYNQPRPQVEGLGHQPNYKIFEVQCVLSVECSGNGACVILI